MLPPSASSGGATNLSGAGVGGPKVYKTHEGEHHTDFSDGSVKITRSTMIFAMCAAVNSCNLGYDIGVSTTAGGLVQEDLGLTDGQRELFVASLNFWSIFGSMFAHWICDKYGRRYSFVVAAVSFIVGLIIMAVSNSFEILMFGRIFVGLGVGFGLAIDPLYIAEISPAAHRGELVTWSEMALNVGIVLGFSAGLIFYNVKDGLQWRLMFLMGSILPVVMILLVRFVMPESPRWLVDNRREAEAKAILKQVYPPGFDVDPVIQDIIYAVERERDAENSIGWSVILHPTPAIKRMMIIGVLTAVAQQAVGIDAIQYYLIDVLEESGIESEKGRLGILILLGLIKLLFVVIGGKMFDRRGRRPLFFVSLIGTLLVVSKEKGKIMPMAVLLYLHRMHYF
jgi:MFS family permease